MHHDGKHTEGANRLAILLRPHNALKHAIDGLEVRRVGGEVDGDLVALRAGKSALCAEVILHIARSLHGTRILRAFELSEDLAVGLTRDVGEHVEATTMRHSDGDLVEVRLCGSPQQGIQERDGGFSAFEAEAFLADVLGLQECLEGLGLIELAQDAQLFVFGWLRVDLFHVLLDPGPLGRVLNVHVLNTERAAVGVAQHAEDLAEECGGFPAESAGHELAVEVPEGEAVTGDLEVGMGALFVFQRVDVRHEVSAHAERVDELLHPSGLSHLVAEVHMDVTCPVDRIVGDSQVGEDLLVEIALADEQLVHLLEELAGAGTLDDAVVVGGGERDRLADAQIGECRERHALELGGVFEGACPDDGARSPHEAGNGMFRADAARVSEGDGVSGIVGGRELIVAGAGDDIFIRDEKLLEAHRLGVFDPGHEQGTRAIGLGDVDRDREVDVRRGDDRWLTVDLVVEHVLAGELFERLHERPGDEVGERDLAASGALEVVVDHDAVVDEKLCWDRAHARRRWHGETGVHVCGE